MQVTCTKSVKIKNKEVRFEEGKIYQAFKFVRYPQGNDMYRVFSTETESAIAFDTTIEKYFTINK